MLWYKNMCLLIWTVFSGEGCGPWASCEIYVNLIASAYVHVSSMILVFKKRTQKMPKQYPEHTNMYSELIF